MNGKRDHFVSQHYLKQFRFGATNQIAIATVEPFRFIGLGRIDRQCQEDYFYERDQALNEILWQFENDTWQLAPSRVVLSCFGPEFEDAEGHLEIEFGIDALFLPQTGQPNHVKMAQSNIKSLLKLVHDLDDALSVDRRQLWTEAGENFAERLHLALLEAG